MRPVIIASAIAVSCSGTAKSTEAQECYSLFDFGQSQAVQAWDTTNDNVMGGKSSGGPAVVDKKLVFAGSTNTDGGGFSSISAAVPKDLRKQITSFEIRYRGDGRDYLFSLETGEKKWLFFRIHYWAPLQTKAQWQTATFPLAAFNPYYHGDPLKPRSLDGKPIKDIGFFIYDKKDGPFQLEVDWIKACTN